MSYVSTWLKTALAAAILIAGATLASAQSRFCAGHPDMVAQLTNRFQEKQLAYGVIGTMAVMEIFASAKGTWTIIVTDVGGQSCIIAAGDGWEGKDLALGPEA